MSTRLLAITLLATACQTGLSSRDLDHDPAAQAEAAPPAERRVEIDWCAGHTLEGPIELSAATWDPTSSGHERLVTISRAGCKGALSDQERAGVADAYRAVQDWSKLPAVDLRDYLAALVQDPDPAARACRDLKPLDEASRGLAVLLRCEKSQELSLEDDLSSALASAAAVQRCFGADRRLGGGAARAPLAAFALCGGEFRALDRAALDRELSDLGVEPVVRTRVRIGLRQIETVLAAFEADLGIERDPALRAFFHEIPERALGEAVRAMQDAADDLAAVRRYEAGYAQNSHAAIAGCFAELRPRLVARIRRAGSSTVGEAGRALGRPVEYQLARALESCAKYDGQGEIAEVLAAELEGRRFLRGPRTVVYWSLREALEARPSARPIELRDLDAARKWLQVPTPLGVPATRTESIPRGRIKRISEERGGLLVEFEPEIESGMERECWSQKRRRGRSSPESCGDWKAAVRTKAEAPAFFPEHHRAGLARGRSVSFFCDYARKPRTCAPLAVWEDDGRETLVAFLGLAL